MVAAYGRILPEDILETPHIRLYQRPLVSAAQVSGGGPHQLGHPERGGDVTGVSIMYMAKELDAGDVILQKETPIGPEEDAQALTVRLAELGAEALSEAVAAIAKRHSRPDAPGREPDQTYASMLTREMSPIDWSRTAREIDCQVRGLIPWPCAACGSGGPAASRSSAPPRAGRPTRPRAPCSPPESGDRGGLRRRAEPVSHGASGRGRQAHGCRRLSAGASQISI